MHQKDIMHTPERCHAEMVGKCNIQEDNHQSIFKKWAKLNLTSASYERQLVAYHVKEVAKYGTCFVIGSLFALGNHIVL